jgi:ABC-type oligopeptide transport system ATPase subunit
MHDEKVILQVNDLKKYFSLRKGFFSETRYIRAVDGVSFELYKGETLGIIGESGCGKSTLGRSLVNLYNITSGSVVYRDGDQKINLINASDREKKD